MLAHDTRHLPGVDEGHIPLVQLLTVAWVFEAQPTQPVDAVVHPVPIEMHHIKGLLGCGGALQGLCKAGKVGGVSTVSSASFPRLSTASTNGKALMRWSM